MSESFRKSAREGAEFGICAGLVLILAELVATTVQRQPAFYSLRQIASAMGGGDILQNMSTGGVILAGIVLHLALAVFFGIIYGLLNARFSDRTQTRWDRQAIIGLLFGLGVWALKLQLIARYAYPELLGLRQLQAQQLILHTFFYGLPMALFAACAERRLRPLRRALEEA